MVTRSRGQLILVGAVIFAAAILLSVALLNTVHVPADISTDQTAHSLDSADIVTQQVHNDLTQLFLVHTSVNETGERLPYAEEYAGPDPPFERAVANYSAVRSDLTVSDTARVVSVEYLNSSQGSLNGTMIRHNDSTRDLTEDDTEWYAIDSANNISYLSLTVTGENGTGELVGSPDPFEVDVGSDTVEFRESEVWVNSTRMLDGSSNDALYPVELEVIDGVAEVRNGTERESFKLDTDAGSVTLVDGNRTTGTYTIVGTGDPVSTDSIYTGENFQYEKGPTLVNPKFRVAVAQGGVAYNTTYRLYNRTAS